MGLFKKALEVGTSTKINLLGSQIDFGFKEDEGMGFFIAQIISWRVASNKRYNIPYGNLWTAFIIN